MSRSKLLRSFISSTLVFSAVYLSACSNPTAPPTGPAQVQAQGLLAPDGWGALSQITATYEDFQDLKGNRDGIWENEDGPAGRVQGIGTTLPFKPWLDKEKSFLKGIYARQYVSELQGFVTAQERSWGQPVTRLNPADLPEFELFRTQKAIALARLGRRPNEVIEGFLNARGSVQGQPIAPRQLFWQRFKPTAQPSGKVVLVSPGFQESGRNFYEQIALLNRQGHDVITMDHQWSGHSRGGQAGGLDRGFGVARDVAAMAAFLSWSVVREYANGELVLFGNSMGAGPGVLAALTLNDNGLIQLEGEAMPKGLKGLLQAPFLSATPNLINKAIGLFSEVPLASTLKLFSTGLPILTYDPVAAQKGGQVVLLEDVRAQLQAMSAANADMDMVKGLIDRGQGPKGSLAIVHGDRDPLADSAQSRWLAEKLPKASLALIPSRNHVLEQSPSEQGHAPESLRQLLSRP